MSLEASSALPAGICWPEDASGVLGVALSGGMDSVALLTMLKNSPYAKGRQILAMHIDHGVRELVSRQKECECVESVAKACTVPLKRRTLSGITQDESSLRQARYDALSEIAREEGVGVVLLAHHREDQLETFFHHLLRGSDLKGLGGIKAEMLWQGQRFCRPLLAVSRREIYDWINEMELAYFADPSNDSHQYTRNHIRHAFFPLLDEFAPDWRERAMNSVASLAEWGQYAEQTLQDLPDELAQWREDSRLWTLDRKLLVALPDSLRKLWIRNFLQNINHGHGSGLRREHVLHFNEFCLSDKTGFSPVVFPGKWQLRGRKTTLLLQQL